MAETPGFVARLHDVTMMGQAIQQSGGHLGNIDQLKAVQEMGVNIAIDDFGTCYFSLAYTAKLPVSTLKIDRVFILSMGRSAEDRNIVSTIIALAHSFNLKVVAEGVKTKEQQHFLRDCHCDEMQGFLFSVPAPIEQIEAMPGRLSV